MTALDLHTLFFIKLVLSIYYTEFTQAVTVAMNNRKVRSLRGASLICACLSCQSIPCFTRTRQANGCPAGYESASLGTKKVHSSSKALVILSSTTSYLMASIRIDWPRFTHSFFYEVSPEHIL